MGDLTGKQDKMIASLLEHRTIGEAASAIGVAASTIYRWLQEPDFQEAYQKARHQVVQQAISYLQHTCSEAVEALREVIMCKDTPPSSRVMAARTILDFSLKGIELDDLVSRIEKLERIVADKKEL
jgi:transposase